MCCRYYCCMVSTDRVDCIAHWYWKNLHMPSFGGEVGRETWPFSLPSFSAKFVNAEMWPYQAQMEPSWQMPIRWYTALSKLTALLIHTETNCVCPLLVVTSVELAAILPYRLSLRNWSSLKCRQTKQIWSPADLMPVRHTALTILTALLMDTTRIILCPLSVVTSAGKLTFWPTEFLCEVVHRLNLTKASKYPAQLTYAS